MTFDGERAPDAHEIVADFFASSPTLVYSIIGAFVFLYLWVAVPLAISILRARRKGHRWVEIVKGQSFKKLLIFSLLEIFLIITLFSLFSAT